jgi:DNA polymerase-1
MGCSLQDAQEYYDMFWGNYAPLAAFRDTISDVWKQRGGKKSGYLKGLDGRKLYARSQHSLVNMMFQSGGSIVVKLATVLTDKWVKKYNIDSWQVLHMHDEFQRETKPEHVEIVKALSCKAFEEAGRYFKMNVPIIGEAKVGANWRDTH